LKNTDIPSDAVQLVESRDEIASLLSQEKYIIINPRYIDLVIPRGSNSLVTYVKSHTHIPVLGHADGICSVYVDGSADVDMCVDVIVDGKVNYPAACNATEKVLIVRTDEQPA
jgi:glutamate-5-semialdehyde dehydrogenase